MNWPPTMSILIQTSLLCFDTSVKHSKTKRESLKELCQLIVEEKIDNNDDYRWEAFKENDLNKGLRKVDQVLAFSSQWFSWSSQKSRVTYSMVVLSYNFVRKLMPKDTIDTWFIISWF